LIGWFVGLLVGWLICWLVGWYVGWLVDMLVGSIVELKCYKLALSILTLAIEVISRKVESRNFSFIECILEYIGAPPDAFLNILEHRLMDQIYMMHHTDKQYHIVTSPKCFHNKNYPSKLRKALFCNPLVRF